MPLPSPNLDDRSFNDLVAEVLARGPAHVPEWTNPAMGDPGRTMVELFAWLTDTLLYRVNLIPERQKLAFLRLLGIQMQPATAATTLISISIDTQGNTLSQFLPGLTSVKGPRPFETRDEVTVLPLIAETFCKRPRTPDEVTATAAKVDELRRLYSLPAGQEPVPYITTPVFAGGKPEEPDGFDLVAGTVDKALWFALLAPDDNVALDALKATLGQSPSGGPQYFNIGLSPVIAKQAFDEDSGPPVPIPYVFELTAPDPNNANGVVYLPLTVAVDRSNGVTTDGVIRLVLPGKDSFFAPSNDVRQNLAAGTGDLPPRIDDAAKAKRLIAWLRLRPLEDLAALKLIWAGINAIEIDQRETSSGIIVGQGTGMGDLEIQLPNGNLETVTFQLQVEESNRGFVQWQSIEDLALAAPQQPVFLLDPEAGKVTFGNGVRGKIPEAGARIRIAQMRSGGGADGNVAAGTLTAVLPNPPAALRLKALQPLPATGGKDSESLDDAVKRIPSVFRHRDRAVTADDYKQLALTTPGVSVGRVEVLPRFKPQQRRSDVPGVVSVMALPARAGTEAPYPNVDRRFREAVHGFLEARKPLGVEMYVIGCEYVQIGLTVGIDNPGGKEEVNTAVKEALQGYLFALPPYGPQNNGWPLGRSVKRRELEVVVSRVEGVEGVSGPNLFVQQNGIWTRVLTPGGADTAEVPLQLWQLPELVSVVVAPGDAPEDFKPPAPKSANDGIPIPVVPEVC
jgi:hypothetical protein